MLVEARFSNEPCLIVVYELKCTCLTQKLTRLVLMCQASMVMLSFTIFDCNSFTVILILKSSKVISSN